MVNVHLIFAREDLRTLRDHIDGVNAILELHGLERVQVELFAFCLNRLREFGTHCLILLECFAINFAIVHDNFNLILVVLLVFSLVVGQLISESIQNMDLARKI